MMELDTGQKPIAVEEQLNNNIMLLQERIAELEFEQEDNGWQRLNFGDRGFEFSLEFLKRIIYRSRLYYLHNPLINRAVSLQADYVFAQGVQIQATDDDVNAVIQAFLEDKRNVREFTGHKSRLMKEQTLMLDGNVFFILFTDMVSTGKVQLRTILVDEITDILTNPDDQNEVWYFKRNWMQRDSISGAVKPMVAYYPDIDYNPSTKPATIQSVGTGGPAPVYWNAPILHVCVGELAKARFGVPEVYSALDWAQAHRNFLQDWATIVRAYARFAFKFTTPGGKNSIVSAKRKIGTTVTTSDAIDRNPPPTTAATFATVKDGPDIEPIKTAGATTSAEDGRELRMMVAAALGIPDTFFGSVDVGNLATARTLDRPTELKFRSRQQLWQDTTQDILTYVIKWALLAPKGKLKGKVKFTIDDDGKLIVDPKDTQKLHTEVVFPPILEHSITDRINAVTEAVTLNGKTFAVSSPGLQKLTIRLMFQALGLNDVDELVKQVFEGVTFTDVKLNPDGTPQTQPDGTTPSGPGSGGTQPAPSGEPDANGSDKRVQA